MRKGICAALVVAMILGICITGCSTEPAQKSTDQVLITVEGETVSLQQYNNDLDYYLESNGLDAANEEDADMVIALKKELLAVYAEETVQKARAREEGLYELTQEEEAEVAAYYQEVMDAWEDYYRAEAQNANADATEEELDQAVQESIDAFIEETGYTKEYIEQVQTDYLVLDKLYTKYTQDISVSQEEVEEQYQKFVQINQETYGQAESSSTFEYALSEGTTIYWAPNGYRYVKHILISIDDETLAEIETLTSEGDTEKADKLYAQALEKILPEAQSVYDSLAADGSNFEEIMQGKTQDAASLTLENGYPIGSADTSRYEENFAKAAMSLEEIGDFSEPVATGYGYHIVYYAADIPSGEIGLENVQEEIEAELLNERQSSAFNDTLALWMEEADIRIDYSLVDLPEDTLVNYYEEKKNVE